MSKGIVSVTDEQIKKVEQMLYGLNVEASKVLSRAINRATTTARAEAVRAVREGYHIRASDVRETMSVHKANAKSLTARVTSKGKTMPLINFDVSPKRPSPGRKSPYTARVSKAGGRTSLGHAFVARMPNGKVGVFERYGPYRRPIGQKIRELHGPSVPQMLGSKGVVEHVSEKAREMMDRRIDHEVKRILGGNS